jgi:probable HAF family extracellular repeat protein
MHHSLLSAVLSLSVLLSTLVAAQDAEYTFTTIDVPGATHTEAYGINTAGQIVGWFQDATGQHGFLRDGATYTRIDVPSALSTVAFGINDSSQIVGHFNDFARTRGFVTADGATFTAINVPGATTTATFGINNSNQIAGWFQDTAGPHGFLTDGATFTRIDVPNALATYAFRINDSDHIVGRFDDATGRHGFLTDGTTFTILAVPGATETQAFGINNSGQIVGWFQDATGTHGFLATPTVPDTTPPAITVAASPATLSPPNGRLVTVTVSGAITDEGSRVEASTYQVIDEYDQIQPSGNISLGTDGSYAFTVGLQASRRGNDQNGRRYTIVVSATDVAGNQGSAPAIVTVPRN